MITVDIEGAEVVRQLFDRKARFAGRFMEEIGRDALDAVKDDIAGEIAGQYYLAGGRSAWKRTVQIGRLPAGREALVSYARKWQAAVPRVSAREAEIRISIPGGGAHMGGRGTERGTTGDFTTIRPTGSPRAMQGAIFRKTGAFIPPSKLRAGLKLPARPHANPDNPTTARKVEMAMARRFEGA